MNTVVDTEPGVVDALIQLSCVVQDILEFVAAEHELSMVQARLLGSLRVDEHSMTELARLLHRDRSSVTGLVSRAEQRGLVQRVGLFEDMRATRVLLTERGRLLEARIRDEVTVRMSDVVAGLSCFDHQRLSQLVSQIGSSA